MEGLGRRLRTARTAAGKTQKEVAKLFGIDRVNVTQWEGDTTRPDPDKLPRLAKFLGVSLDWLLKNEGVGPGLSGAPVLNPKGHIAGLYVPLVGYVGANSKAHFYAVAQQYLGKVPAIDGATDKTVAVEIWGDSLGEVFNNWLAYYDDVRRPVTPDLHRALCVVGLPDERILIKKLHPTQTPGLYDLLSADDPIEGVRVDWAAKVKALTPR